MLGQLGLNGWKPASGQLLLGLTFHPQHFTSVQRRCNALLGWAEHTAPTPQGWHCQAKQRAVGFWGHQWPQRSPASYLLLPGTPFHLVLDWFYIRCWAQKGVMKSLLLSAEPAGGTYLGCASPAAQSHRKLQLLSVF